MKFGKLIDITHNAERNAKMKKITALLLVFAVAACIASCSKKDGEIKTGDSGKTKNTTAAVTDIDGNAVTENEKDTASTSGAGTSQGTADAPKTTITLSEEQRQQLKQDGLDPDKVDIVDAQHPDVDPEPADSFISTDGTDFSSAESYSSVKQAMTAAGVTYEGLESKFEDFRSIGTYVLKDKTLVIRFGYSSTYMDFRINSSGEPYTADLAGKSFAYTATKTADNGDTVTVKGDSEDELYTASCTEGKNRIVLVTGEPLPWEEFNWRLSE